MRPSVPLLAVLLAACSDATREVAPIRLDALETIGVEEGAGAMATWPRVSARHPGGYRILVPQPGGVPALPAVYGDDGTYLGALGAPGDGLDQFREPLFVRFGPGDSVYVFDGARRVLIFSPTRVYARTVVLPITPWDAAVLPDGRIVIASSIHEHALPLVVIHGDGSADREIGTSDSVSMATPSPRRIVVAADGTIWTVSMTGRWRLEHWDMNGALLGALDRTPDWYPPYGRELGVTPGRAPQPTLQDAWFDAAGRLWVLGKAADAKWEDGLGSEVNGDAGAVATIDDPDKVSDTILEVLDVATGQLLAEARFDPTYPFAVEPGTVMRVRTNDHGWHRAELARIVLDTTRITSPRP